MTMYYRNGESVFEGEGYLPHRETRFTCFTPAILAVKGDFLPELYRERSECCGCGACRYVCPVGAISMIGDEEGFAYPVVDADTCIGCRKCMGACVFKSLG